MLTDKCCYPAADLGTGLLLQTLGLLTHLPQLQHLGQLWHTIIAIKNPFYITRVRFFNSRGSLKHYLFFQNSQAWQFPAIPFHQVYALNCSAFLCPFMMPQLWKSRAPGTLSALNPDRNIQATSPPPASPQRIACSSCCSLSLWFSFQTSPWSGVPLRYWITQPETSHCQTPAFSSHLFHTSLVSPRFSLEYCSWNIYSGSRPIRLSVTLHTFSLLIKSPKPLFLSWLLSGHLLHCRNFTGPRMSFILGAAHRYFLEKLSPGEPARSRSGTQEPSPALEVWTRLCHRSCLGTESERGGTCLTPQPLWFVLRALLWVRNIYTTQEFPLAVTHQLYTQQLLETSRKEQRLQQERRIRRKSRCLSCACSFAAHGREPGICNYNLCNPAPFSLGVHLCPWAQRLLTHSIYNSAPGLHFQWLRAGCVSNARTRDSACTMKPKCAHRSSGWNKNDWMRHRVSARKTKSQAIMEGEINSN